MQKIIEEEEKKHTKHAHNCDSESKFLDMQPLNEDMIKKLTYLRYSHDFSNPVQTLWPERQQDIWKTEVLDMVYHIAIISIPVDIVPTIYLQILREFTMFHLDAAWKASKDNGTITELDVGRVVDHLSTCSNLALKNQMTLQDVNQKIFHLIFFKY